MAVSSSGAGAGAGMGRARSRMDASGNAAFNPTGHRGLVNTGDGWKVQRMFFVNPIAVDTD